jgi:hypothetical protein
LFCFLLVVGINTLWSTPFSCENVCVMVSGFTGGFFFPKHFLFFSQVGNLCRRTVETSMCRPKSCLL